MKIIGQKIYLTVPEMVECGFNAKTISNAKQEASKCWDIISDPDDGRKLLVGYAGLTPERKRLVELRFGNPWDHMATQPILDMVVNDWRANEYYRAYRYTSADGETRMLGIDVVNKYTRAAGWLNLINGIGSENWRIKRELKIGVDQFKKSVAKLVALEKERGQMAGYAGLDVLAGNFPSSHQRLWALAREYKTGGYDKLIDARMGNKLAAKLGKTNIPLAPLEGGMAGNGTKDLVKVGENGGEMARNGAEMALNGTENSVKGGGFDKEIYEQQIAVIRYCCGLHNNLDGAQVKKTVDIVFAKKGWKTVGRATIARFMKENTHLLAVGRKGPKEYMNTIAMQVKRKAPGFPMVYWTMDGWTVELMYKEPAKGGAIYSRLVAVIVLDPHNKYPIGYAIGERETPELIKMALRNAIEHTQELFGKPYHPLQLQADNYQIKKLTPFYQGTASLFIPTAVGNAKAKVIEPYNMYLNKRHCQPKRNWSGFNVDASKEKRINREMMDALKADFPNRDGVAKQIHEIFRIERAEKIAAYREGWANLPEVDKREMKMAFCLYSSGVAADVWLSGGNPSRMTTLPVPSWPLSAIGWNWKSSISIKTHGH